MSAPAGPFSIGSHLWPGVSRVAEEAGELLQVLGKLIGSGGEPQHWDGTRLDHLLWEEVADVRAALEFLIEANDLPYADIHARTAVKLERYRRWHSEGLSASGVVSPEGDTP